MIGPKHAFTVEGGLRSMGDGLRLNLATPSYGGSFSAEYVTSLYHLIYALMRREALLTHSTVDYADIAASRNHLVTNFYYGQRECSHLLFVDSDIGFPAELVLDMLGLRSPVVGAFIPRRGFGSKGPADAFVGEAHPTEDRNGMFRRATKVGAGLLLIERQAITRMIQRVPDICRPPQAAQVPVASVHERFLAPFDKVEVGGQPLSEDYSFCWRWTEKCGGLIWAAGHHKITHTGRQVFRGRYDDIC